MFGFGGGAARGGDVQRAQQLVQEEEEEEDLAGVGIVFVRAPDDSLFVKSIIEGSGAQSSGIQVGDCLMKVKTRCSPLPWCCGHQSCGSCSLAWIFALFLFSAKYSLTPQPGLPCPLAFPLSPWA